MLCAAVWCLVTGGVWTGIGMYFNAMNRRGCDPVSLNVLGGIFLFLISLLSIRWEALGAAGWTLERLPALLVAMALAGMSMGLGMVLMIVSMKKGPPPVAWAICQSSLVIPFSLGVLINGERANALNIAGLLAVVIGIVLFSRGRTDDQASGRKSGRGWFWIALAGFFVIGLSQYFFSIPSYWKGWTDEFSLRIPIQALAGMFFLAALRPTRLCERRTSLWLYGLLFALLTFAGRACLYKTIDTLSLLHMVSIAYPVCLGLSILGVAASDAVSKRRVEGRTLSVCALIAAGILLLGVRSF